MQLTDQAIRAVPGRARWLRLGAGPEPRFRRSAVLGCVLIIVAIGNVFHPPDGPHDLVVPVDSPLFPGEFDLVPAGRVGMLIMEGGISGRYTVPDADQFPAVDHSRPESEVSMQVMKCPEVRPKSSQ